MHMTRLATLKIAALIGLLAVTAAFACGSAQAAPHVKGQLVVSYEPGTSGAERDAIRAAAGVRSDGTISPTSQRVEVIGDRDVNDVAKQLESQAGVAHADPNYVAATTAFQPNDPGRTHVSGQWTDLQWNFVGNYGIRVPDAWQNAINAGAEGGRNVVVAVLDTGIAYKNSANHRYKRSPDLAANGFVSGYDFVQGNHQPYDRNGHGTFVAGTIAQHTNNGFGVTGIAYRSKLMPVRVLNADGAGDVTTIARGIRFAARNGAKVLNMSFEFDIGLTASRIPEVISAVRYAHKRGAVLVAASGNGQESKIAYPARAHDVIAVGATTERGCLADYSNTGNGLDIVAPGGGTDALIIDDPHCDASRPGRDIYQYTFTGTNPRRFGLPSGYEGTSMAVPHVVGTAALVIAEGQLGPNPSPEAVEQKLESSARDLGAKGFDATYGAGLLDAAAATALPATPNL